MKYFFYGTLMDDAVLYTVIGRRIPMSCRCGAVIFGYRRVYRADAWYPILLPTPGNRVDGILVTGLTQAEAACLAAFEGDEYGVAEVPVTLNEGKTTRAKAFLPAPGVPASSREWTFQQWRQKSTGGNTSAGREPPVHAEQSGIEGRRERRRAAA